MGIRTTVAQLNQTELNRIATSLATENKEFYKNFHTTILDP